MKESTTMIIFLKNWLSNFHASPLVENDLHFLQVEQYFMFHKANFFQDETSMAKILAAKTPSEAKALGREIKPFDERWAEVRYAVMYQGNLLKYQQNPTLRDKLLATGNKILVEANPVDPIWGVGLAEDDPRAACPAFWQGKNLLGLCLMEVRAQILAEK